MGSSPLARGLHEVAKPTAEAVGIIPARAGFTRDFHTLSTSRQDHPRSRGVYQSTRRSFQGTIGSSPLARGLLIKHVRFNNANRIIPARAGFTVINGDLNIVVADHPRSRGVYIVSEVGAGN